MNTIKNIFLTDDDADDCLIFSEMLHDIYREGLPKLTIANDGIELLSVLEDTCPPPPHVIFLDINMPKKNGIECLQEIRSTPKYKGIPVVMFSTSSNEDLIDKTYEFGANYYLTKSQSYPKLKECLIHVLSFGAQKLKEQPSRSEFVIRVN